MTKQESRVNIFGVKCSSFLQFVSFFLSQPCCMRHLYGPNQRLSPPECNAHAKDEEIHGPAPLYTMAAAQACPHAQSDAVHGKRQRHVTGVSYPLWYWRGLFVSDTVIFFFSFFFFLSSDFALTFKAQCMHSPERSSARHHRQQWLHRCGICVRHFIKDGLKMSHFYYRCGDNLSDEAARKQNDGAMWKWQRAFFIFSASVHEGQNVWNFGNVIIIVISARPPKKRKRSKSH